MTGLASAFGTLLLQVTDNLRRALLSTEGIGSSETAAAMLVLASVVFLVIAVYVGAVVTTNTVATIVAGRVRRIALLRLLGSTTRAQRSALSREALLASLIGVLAGGMVAVALVRIGTQLAVGAGFMPAIDYPLVNPMSLWPLPLVVLTTLWAAWIGSRRVAGVTPLQALGASGDRSVAELRKPRRAVGATVLIVAGFALLFLGIALGLVSPLGVLVGLIGGVLSFTGIVLAAERIVPPALRFVGRLFGGSPAAVQASANALRYPERSARSTIGLVIGVTLITMFAVAMGTWGRLIIVSVELYEPSMVGQMEQEIAAVTAVFSGLVGVSAVIAAVGLVNVLSVSVLQRHRELGLLRALGFTSRQVRWMIVAEAAQLTLAALVVAVPLGVFYGWAGAQSLLGSMAGAVLIAPTVPWLVIGCLVAAAAVLTALASLTPARRATRISPVEALATS